MQKLFFQLIQVSIGQLDCLDRGPSPEEWQTLYDLSKKHGLLTICYDGVVRLFDFGLRAPQDLSIDWMAETETEQTETGLAIPQVTNPIRRMLVDRWVERNGSSLYDRNQQPQQLTPTAAIVVRLLQAFEDYHAGTLTLHTVVDCCLQLREMDAKKWPFRDGSTIKQMLQTFGIWRFAQAMMWVTGEVTRLDASKMVCKPSAAGGRFLLEEIMAEQVPVVTRVKNRMLRFIKY
ncbi:MAG: hypothetical protein II886_10500 [Prevotella sp.]|nr:hypothetical protein [Prevotella sp.]